MEQLQLATYEQSKRLSDLGFDYATVEYYNGNGNLFTCKSCRNSERTIWGHVSAPTAALVREWFMDKWGLFGTVMPIDDFGQGLAFYYLIYNNKGKQAAVEYGWCYERDKSESALLDKLIELITLKN